MKKYDVAVCVATYFPQRDKLIHTLQSIVKQRNIDFQIIVSDDGSHNNYFMEIEQFFREIEFSDYKLVAFTENQGTVRNIEQAVLAAEAKYVKAISPGDELTEDTVLAEWVAHLENSGKLWSFSDAYYYSLNDNGEPIYTACYANPQLVDVYLQHSDLQCRWNYVVLDDIALGAATLCDRDFMLKYIQELAGKVKYAEDNIYRLMMFDGYVASYFPCEAVMYEFGNGVSTSGSELWARRLQDDWEVTVSVMLSRTVTEKLQKKMKKILEKRGKSGKVMRKIRRYAEKGRIGLILKQRLNKRLANTERGCIDCK